MRNLYAIVLPIFTICCLSYTLLSGQNSAPATALPAAEPPMQQDKHEFKNSVYTNDLIKYYKSNGKTKNHIVTKFSRQDLIDILSQSKLDSVKFVIGAYSKDESVRKKKGRSVILLQVEEDLVDPRRQAPGGNFAMFKYLEGAICPPPSDCSVE